MSFGNRLKELRKKHQLSQEEMAERLYMSQSNYNTYENDNRSPNIEMVNQVVKTFEVDLAWLMSGDQQKIVFENGSIVNGGGVINTDNYYYTIPKELLDTLLLQLKTNSKIIEETMKRLVAIENKIGS